MSISRKKYYYYFTFNEVIVYTRSLRRASLSVLYISINEMKQARATYKVYLFKEFPLYGA